MNRLNAQIARAANEVRQRWPDWMVEKIMKISMRENIMSHEQQISDLKKYSKPRNYCYVDMVSDEAFNCGVKMTVGWMMARFESLHQVECPRVLDECIDALVITSEMRADWLACAYKRSIGTAKMPPERHDRANTGGMK